MARRIKDHVDLAIARAHAETAAERLAAKLTAVFRKDSPRGSDYVDTLLAQVMPGGWRILGTDDYAAVLVQDRQDALVTDARAAWMQGTTPLMRVAPVPLIEAITRAKAVAGPVRRYEPAEVVLAWASESSRLTIYTCGGTYNDEASSCEDVPVDGSLPVATADHLIAVDPAQLLPILRSVRDLPTVDLYGKVDLLDLRFMGVTRAHRILLMGMRHETPPRSVQVWQRATSGVSPSTEPPSTAPLTEAPR